MTTFVVIGAIQVLSALPLIGAPNVRIKAQAPGAIRASRLGALLDASYGWLAACFMFTWQIALFLSLGSNLGAYGGAMALAALVGALSGLVLGRNIDMGHGRRAVTIAYGAAAALVLLRVFSFGTPWLAVLANALGSIVLSLMAPALGTPIYNLSKASPCPMRFSIATEAGYDVGCFAGCVMAAGIAWAGMPLWIAVLMTLPALAASTWLLRRYYADNPTIEAALKA